MPLADVQILLQKKTITLNQAISSIEINNAWEFIKMLNRVANENNI